MCCVIFIVDSKAVSGHTLSQILEGGGANQANP